MVVIECHYRRGFKISLEVLGAKLDFERILVP